MNSWVEINYQNLWRNISQLRRRVGNKKFIAVVKSNAYGHGIDLIARACQKIKAVDWVATIGDEEAWRVRQAGCRKPILVLSYYDPHSIILRHIRKIRLPLYNKEQALILNQRNLGIPLHLKINTGTSRLGLKPDEVLNFCKWLQKSCPNLVIEGVWSHLARAEEALWTTTKLQRQRLNQAVKAVRVAGYNPKYIHIDCSASTLREASDASTMVRIGLAMYGLWPSEATKRLAGYRSKLKPILTWKTSIIALQRLKRGEAVGYGHGYKCTRYTHIATLPLGYWEGYRRSYADGYVLIRGEKCPIRGRICMNLIHCRSLCSLFARSPAKAQSL